MSDAPDTASSAASVGGGSDALDDNTRAEVSHLFHAQVSTATGTKWWVLIRAVDEESAKGALEARGHRVLVIRPGERPAKSVPWLAITCPACQYSLRGIPPGPTGFRQCPECGVIALEPGETLRKLSMRSLRPQSWQPRSRMWLIGLFVAVGAVFGYMAWRLNR